jgi:tetratricopeptide (TPR) repeat protein
MQEFLVDAYRRQGRIDDLRARAGELRAAPETRRQAEQILDSIASLTGDYRRIAERAEQRAGERGEEPFGAEAWRIAESWLRAGDGDRAVDWLRKVLDFESPTLDRAARADQRNRVRHYTGDSDTQDNPFAFGFESGYSSWWSSWRSEDLDDWRRGAAAALRHAGDVERAGAVERDLLDQPTPERRLTQGRELAQAYARFDLPREAARVLRALLDAPALDLDDEDRDRLLAGLVSALRDAGDDSARATAVEERLAGLEARIAAEPGPNALGLRWTRAATLIGDAGRAEEGLAELDALLALRPEDQRWLAMRARALLDLGRHEEAVDGLRELSELHRWEGEQDPASETATLGLALAELGRTDEARAELTRAVDRLARDDRLRDEVVAALESLR